MHNNFSSYMYFYIFIYICTWICMCLCVLHVHACAHTYTYTHAHNSFIQQGIRDTYDSLLDPYNSMRTLSCTNTKSSNIQLDCSVSFFVSLMAINSLSVFSSDKAGDTSFNCLFSISALKFSMSCWLKKTYT